jgi:transposase
MRPPGSPEELERRRHRAVTLLAKGHGLTDVARMLGVDRRSVRRWKAAYRHHGAKALRARRASGRPPKLTPRHLQQVERVLLKGAQAAGFGTDLWTCPRIAQVMAHRFGVRYHVDHLSRLLHALGWSPQKPQRRAVERDEPAIQGWIKQTWPRVKKKLRA